MTLQNRHTAADQQHARGTRNTELTTTPVQHWYSNFTRCLYSRQSGGCLTRRIHAHHVSLMYSPSLSTHSSKRKAEGVKLSQLPAVHSSATVYSISIWYGSLSQSCSAEYPLRSTLRQSLRRTQQRFVKPCVLSDALLHSALQRFADTEHDEAVAAVAPEVLQAHGGGDVSELLLLPPAVRRRAQKPRLDLKNT